MASNVNNSYILSRSRCTHKSLGWYSFCIQQLYTDEDSDHKSSNIALSWKQIRWFVLVLMSSARPRRNAIRYTVLSVIVFLSQPWTLWCYVCNIRIRCTHSVVILFHQEFPKPFIPLCHVFSRFNLKKRENFLQRCCYAELAQLNIAISSIRCFCHCILLFHCFFI